MVMERDRPPSTSLYYCNVEVAAHLVQLPASRVRRYLKAGLVHPAVIERGKPLLGPLELARLRKIRRLAEDLGLNYAGVEVVVRLLDEIERLGMRRGAPNFADTLLMEPGPDARPTRHGTGRPDRST
jgi:MerR family transcriptional regulator, heat shock protein HspR